MGIRSNLSESTIFKLTNPTVCEHFEKNKASGDAFVPQLHIWTIFNNCLPHLKEDPREFQSLDITQLW